MKKYIEPIMIYEEVKDVIMASQLSDEGSEYDKIGADIY